jgi:hypothetical protein
MTPTVPEETRYHRFEEIMVRIAQAGNSGNWLALDDAIDEFPTAARDRLLHCKTEVGFDDAAAVLLRKLLARAPR